MAIGRAIQTTASALAIALPLITGHETIQSQPIYETGKSEYVSVEELAEVIHILETVEPEIAIAIPVIAKWEGVRTKPYKDIAGITTWCYGETQGTPKESYHLSECIVLLAERLKKNYLPPARRCTENWLDIPVKSRGMGLSLIWNIGTNAYCEQSSVAREFRKGNFAKACDKFKLWNKSRVNGRLKKIDGLVNRRADESSICLEGLTENA